MSDSVRRLKANKVIAGKKCGWCRDPLDFAVDAAVCEECRALHHAACWDDKGGCARAGCVNEPLRRSEPAKVPGVVPGVGPGMGPGTGTGSRPIASNRIECPHCGKSMRRRDPLCPHCRLAPTASGEYEGPKRNAPGAVSSLVCGIVAYPVTPMTILGLLAGLVLGITAIVNGAKAKGLVRRDPRYGGGGMGTAGMVLGIVYLSLLGLGILGAIATVGRY